MNLLLSDYAAIAEIIASIAVILSLVFVGFQMRESNRAGRVNAVQTTWEFEMELAGKMADHAETWNKAVRGQEFSDDIELRRAIILFNMLMSESENRYFQYREGYLENSEWEARRRSLELLVKLPVFLEWQKSISARNHSDAFLAMVKTLTGELETATAD